MRPSKISRFLDNVKSCLYLKMSQHTSKFSNDLFTDYVVRVWNNIQMWLYEQNYIKFPQNKTIWIKLSEMYTSLEIIVKNLSSYQIKIFLRIFFILIENWNLNKNFGALFRECYCQLSKGKNGSTIEWESTSQGLLIRWNGLPSLTC